MIEIQINNIANISQFHNKRKNNLFYKIAKYVIEIIYIYIYIIFSFVVKLANICNVK
jgi:hypothetical protein